MASDGRVRKKAKVCRHNSSILEFFSKTSGGGSTVTTESPTHTDSEHSVEGTREDSNSEESMDDDDEPVPENDDEPSSDESSDDGTTITKAVSKPSKSTITVRLEPHQPKKSKFPTILSGGQCRSFQSSWYSKWPWLE